ncbi:MAG: ferredoxin, partial [Microbacteriaceae bacterium]
MDTDFNVDTPSARLHIDWTRCDGRGLCTELLPDILTRDDWGYPQPNAANIANRSDVPIPPKRLDAAEEAVKLCPLLALTLR